MCLYMVIIRDIKVVFKCLKVNIIVCSEDEASDGLGRGADRGTRGPRWTLRQRLVQPGVLHSSCFNHFYP